MADYKKKDAVTLAYEENKRRVRMEGAIILTRVMNEAIAEMTEQFQDALSRGELLTIGGSQEEMREFFLKAAGRLLESPTPGGRPALRSRQ